MLRFMPLGFELWESCGRSQAKSCSFLWICLYLAGKVKEKKRKEELSKGKHKVFLDFLLLVGYIEGISARITIFGSTIKVKEKKERRVVEGKR